MKKQAFKKMVKDFWYFLWEDDSFLSWIVNVIIAFIIVKFLIYPGLGFALGTNYPVVAVVSSSMEHNSMNFDDWWEENGHWYDNRDITYKDFSNYKFSNGFNMGDIMVLKGIKPKDIKKGIVIVYSSENYMYPVIHRVTGIEKDEEMYYFETKGDNNKVEDFEMVKSSQLLGKAVLRMPYLGWVKIIFTKLIGG